MIQVPRFHEAKICGFRETFLWMMQVFWTPEFRKSTFISFAVIAYQTGWNVAMPIFLSWLFDGDNMINATFDDLLWKVGGVSLLKLFLASLKHTPLDRWRYAILRVSF